VRIGISEADVIDDGSSGTLTLEFATRADLELTLDNFLYAYGAPAFSQREWLDIADGLDYAVSQAHSKDLKERLHHFAKQIRDAYGLDDIDVALAYYRMHTGPCSREEMENAASPTRNYRTFAEIRALLAAGIEIDQRGTST
jgi:hypothetical protein